MNTHPSTNTRSASPGRRAVPSPLVASAGRLPETVLPLGVLLPSEPAPSQTNSRQPMRFADLDPSIVRKLLTRYSPPGSRVAATTSQALTNIVRGAGRELISAGSRPARLVLLDAQPGGGPHQSWGRVLGNPTRYVQPGGTVLILTPAGAPGRGHVITAAGRVFAWVQELVVLTTGVDETCPAPPPQAEPTASNGRGGWVRHTPAHTTVLVFTHRSGS